ncbi:MAG TPA: 3'-5' exonuclease, partial [Candidatus Binatia bacterium]|nr:3'-5' exonuclease [Candidatus Binatia bacterium]
MKTVQWYLTDCTYRILQGKAVVHLYGRTPEGKLIAVHDEHFEPYFYVLPRSIPAATEALLALTVTEKRDEYRVTHVEEVTKNVNEREEHVLKVFVNLPSGVPPLKDAIKSHPAIRECYEYDIKFIRRYLIDKGLQPMTLIEATGEFIEETSRVPVFKAASVKQANDTTYTNPRILGVDIETYNPLGKRVLVDQHPIVMIALYGEKLKKVLTWKKFTPHDATVEFLPSEADMLVRFKELLIAYAPDLLVGYYSDGFDLPYIIKRAAKHKIELDVGLDYSEMKISGTAQSTVQVTGIVHVDIFKFIKKVIGRSMETDVFTLDAVAEELLGERKHEVNLDTLARDWDAASPALDTFAKYNLQDAKLTHDLC